LERPETASVEAIKNPVVLDHSHDVLSRHATTTKILVGLGLDCSHWSISKGEDDPVKWSMSERHNNTHSNESGLSLPGQALVS
jgi:hypothetical protein